MPNIGERYERFIQEGSFWRHEVREVLDSSPLGVVYREIKEPVEGTTPDQGWDEDYPKALSMHEWEEWEALARVEESKGNTPRDP